MNGRGGKLCCKARRPDGPGAHGSEQPRAVWNGLVWRKQNDAPRLVGETQGENLGHELADLARREVDHSRHLTPDQIIAARRGGSQDAKHDALVKFTLAVHEKRGFVSEADLAAFRKAGYTDGHVAEVVACYALNVFTNTFNHVNDTAVDFPAAPVL